MEINNSINSYQPQPIPRDLNLPNFCLSSKGGYQNHDTQQASQVVMTVKANKCWPK